MGDFAKLYKVVTETLDTVTQRVVKYMKGKGLTLSCAESCTGGLISQCITSVSGASAIYKGGVCSYSEETKMRVLGVSKKTLERYTVYSEQTADEMSAGVMSLIKTDAAIAVTGIAGPDGGTEMKPVGTVYVSVRVKDKKEVRDLALYREYDELDRKLIRLLAAQKALEMLLELMTENEV